MDLKKISVWCRKGKFVTIYKNVSDQGTCIIKLKTIAEKYDTNFFIALKKRVLSCSSTQIPATSRI